MSSIAKVRLAAAWGVIAFLTVNPYELAFAQDSHYWTYQYGTRANLLGGLVVGSVVDISAAYYNPGALALLDDIELIATSSIAEASNLSITGAQGRTASDFQLAMAPGFFGGILPFNFLGKHVLAYSFFTRYRFKTDMEETVLGQRDLPELGIGVVDYFGEAFLRRDLGEQWGGLSWSMPVGNKLGVGVSQFVTYRGQSGTNRLSGEAYSPTSGEAVTLYERRFSYYNWGLLWKVGMTFDWRGISLGVTATTPRISVFGRGDGMLNRTVFGQDIDRDGVEDPYLSIGYEEELSATFKSAPGVGLGATYQTGKYRIHFSAEYVAKLSEYDVLDLQDFESQSHGNTVAFDLRNKFDDVLNAGVALENEITDWYTSYASFRTDFSASPTQSISDISSASWNLYHLTAGAALKIGSANITLGAGLSWGGRSGFSLANEEDYSDRLLAPMLGESEVKYRSGRLFFAFSF